MLAVAVYICIRNNKSSEKFCHISRCTREETISDEYDWKAVLQDVMLFIIVFQAHFRNQTLSKFVFLDTVYKL